MDNKVLLASDSPRRRELLALLLGDFEVEGGGFDEETVSNSLCAVDHVLYCSRMKAESVAGRYPEKVIIGADTIVVLDNIIMGKPKDIDEARRMLNTLSGRTHDVYSGITVIANSCSKSGYERTRVSFGRLTDRMIEKYIATNEPMDKAGAYGIQGIGSALIRRISGCYFNVVGLPIYRLSKILTDLGVPTYLS